MVLPQYHSINDLLVKQKRLTCSCLGDIIARPKTFDVTEPVNTAACFHLHHIDNHINCINIYLSVNFIPVVIVHYLIKYIFRK